MSAEPNNWRDQAACKGQPVEWFYADKYAARALITCWSCPVATECGRHADLAGEEFGVWGASTKRLRRDHPERINVRAILERELSGCENWVYARELAARLGLERNTVQKVLGRMVDSGVLEVRHAGKRVNQWRWNRSDGSAAGIPNNRETVAS